LIFGEKDDLKVSFQFSVPSQSTSSGNGSSSSSGSSDTVIDTIDAINEYLSNKK